jgi:hypothetical protein
MSYLEVQRQKSILSRDLIFKDPGGGIFRNAVREFLHKETAPNKNNHQQ